MEGNDNSLKLRRSDNEESGILFVDLYCFCTVSTGFVTVIDTSRWSPGVKKEKLVRHWTFEKGEEEKDLTGNFPDNDLKGAKFTKGGLDVDAGKWAITVGDYKGLDITDKTLVSWATMQDVGVSKGSILCIG